MHTSGVAELTEKLRQFNAPNSFEKPEERSLLNWFVLLNKFDEVLDAYIKHHQLLAVLPKAISGGNPFDSHQTILGSGRGSPQVSVIPGGRIRLQDSYRFPSSLSSRIESLVRSRMTERATGQSANSPEKKEGKQPPAVEPEPPSAALVEAVLKATFKIVRNASQETKNVYNSYEHILTLIVDANPSISVLSLEILHALLSRSQKGRSARTPSSNGVADRLRDIAQGWGGREKGLGLVDCCNSMKDSVLPNEGHSIQIEFNSSKAKSKSNKESDSAPRTPTASGNSKKSAKASSGDLPNVSVTFVGDVTRVSVRDIRDLPQDEKWLLTEFAAKHKIPRTHLFGLLVAFRRAKAFGESRIARLGVVCQQLIALTTLAQLYPHPKALAEIFEKETELITDIVTLANGDGSYGLSDLPKTLRTLAIRCLAAMSVERSRMQQITTAAGIGTHHGVFSSLLRAEVASLTSRTGDQGASSGAVKMDTDSTITVPVASVTSEGSNDDVRMAEALLSLVLSIAVHGGSSASSGLVASGVLGIIVPLVRNREPSHQRAVSQAIRAINEIIQLTHSTVGSQAFRDHDGLNILAERIAVETLGNVKEAVKMSEKELVAEDERVEVAALHARTETRELYEGLLSEPLTAERALAHPAPSSSAASRGMLPHSKWTLLKVLHSLFLHALGMGGSPVRELVSSSALPYALRQILARPFHYGGGLFSNATTAAVTIAHSEPVATADLVKAGISKALIRSIQKGLPPYGECLKVIPNALAAICLATDARPEIVKASPIRPYILRLATPFYTRALHGDVTAQIGGSLDEMMRHVDDLREIGNAAVREFLKKAAAFVELEINERAVNAIQTAEKGSAENAKRSDTTASASKPPANGSVRKSTSANTLLGEKSKSEKTPSGEVAPSNYVVLERMKMAVAHNAATLIGFQQGSSEHQKSIVQGKGLDEMLKFRIPPALASVRAITRDNHASSRSSPAPSKAVQSLSSSMKSFLARHDGAVLTALFNVVREDAGKVLVLAEKLGDAWLPEEDESKPKILKRASGSKDGITRKRTRAQASLADSQDGETEGKTESKRQIRSAEELAAIRAQLRDALCILRIDVVLMGNMSRGGSHSLVSAWDSAEGSSVISLVASVERLVRYNLALAYSGLSLATNNDSDLSTATVTAAKIPVMVPLSATRVTDGIQGLSGKMGLGPVKPTEIVAACKTVQVLPDKESEPRQELKGLPWAMETFTYSCQKLYMSLGRGMVFSSRRASRDVARHARPIRGLAATIGNLFVLHLKAADTLWSKSVSSMGQGNVCAAWDYVRRILSEIKSTVFCESNRNTQGLILRFFLSSGGAKAIRDACRPLDLLKGSRNELQAQGILNPKAYADNKKRFETFLKSSKLNSLYSVMVLGKVRKMRKKPRSGTSQSSKDVSKLDSVVMTDNPKMTDKEVEALEKQLSVVSCNVLHYRKQTVVQKTAGNAWAALCGLLQLLSNCPGLLVSSPASMPSDPDVSVPGEWQAKDVQRSAQYLTMSMLEDVTAEPKELLSAFRSTGSQTSDVVSIILSILRSSSELTGLSDSYSTENRQDSEDLERQNTSEEPPTVNPGDVQSLVDMGFPEARAREALRRTPGIEYAMEWILSHPDDENQEAEDSDDSSDDGDDDDEDDDEDDEEEEDDDEVQNDSDGDVAIQDAPADDVEVGDTEMNPAEDDQSLTAGEGEHVAIPDEDMDVPDIQQEIESNDSSKPVPSDGVKTDPAELLKAKAAQPVIQSVDKDAEDLLHLSINRDLDDVSATISAIKSVSAEDKTRLLAMISSIVAQEPSTCKKTSRGSSRQKIMSRARHVSSENYKSSKKKLFQSLIPVAKAAITHEMGQGNSSHASFVAVEILSILQKDKCLTEEVRLDFANVITKELERFLVSPKSMSNGINSVVGVRVSFVWAHYGGSQARNALKSSGVANIAFRTILEMSNSWESLGNAKIVDEEATKPIRDLTISEKMDLEENLNLSPNASGAEKNKLTVPRKSQMQVMNCVTTCSLILDAFVRYHSRDSLIDHTTERPSKDETSMEVDDDPTTPKEGAVTPKEDTSAEDVVSSEKQDEKSKDASDSVAKMEVDEIIPVNIAEISRDAKSRAKKERNEATEKAVDELLTWTGTKSKKYELPFSAEELLNCAMKLISSLSGFEVGDCMIALLQLVCSLTSDFHMAKKFMDSDGVELLLSLPHLETKKARTTSAKMTRNLVRTILRHVLEDADTLREAMESEIRLLLHAGNGRSRPSTSTRSLVASSSGMIGRNLECFTRALATCTRARAGVNSAEQILQTVEYTPLSMEHWMEESKKRANVVRVVGNLTKLLAKPASATKAKDEKPGSIRKRRGLKGFALSQLSELVQLCPVIAAEFLQVQSPDPEMKGSALDFIVQKLLPVDVGIGSTGRMFGGLQSEQEQVADYARSLVVALMLNTPNAHKISVKALAEAVRIESEREVARGGVLKSVSLCILPCRKMKVLREMIDSDVANHLAKCLDKLDMSEGRNENGSGNNVGSSNSSGTGNSNGQVASAVLKALSVIGSATEQMRNDGKEPDESEMVPSRDMWSSLRAGPESVSPLAHGYVVI